MKHTVDSWAPLGELVEDVRTGKTTAVELTKRALANCEAASEYNALITVNQNALDAAAAVDARVASGDTEGALLGIPYIAKDNYLTKDLRTTAASNLLKDFVPPMNATVIQKLEDAGAIIVAKANLDAYAHGGSTENSDMGVTLNPYDKTKVPGGSSGGSAAAVALGIAPFALGSDTGGSIRQPASFCGVVGYKPTYGLASRSGIVAMVSSTDTMGVLAPSVADSALVMNVITGRDPRDSTTIEKDPLGYIVDGSATDLKGKKVGIITEHLGEGVSEDVQSAVAQAAEKLKQQGADVSEISIPELKHSLATYYVIMPAEVSSNLSRYDGVRYGSSSDSATTLEEQYVMNRTEGFNAENKRRIMMGAFVLSSGYYDAYYKKAQQVRTLLVRRFNEVFEEFDFLLGPVAPTTAFDIGKNSDDPLQMYLEDVMTVGVSLAGLPAISVPVSCDKAGMPIGAQLIAAPRHDRQLLSFANQFESIMEFNS